MSFGEIPTVEYIKSYFFDNSNECTYSYSKSQIIQDYDEKSKVKTYKKYY